MTQSDLASQIGIARRLKDYEFMEHPAKGQGGLEKCSCIWSNKIWYWYNFKYKSWNWDGTQLVKKTIECSIGSYMKM